MDTEKGFAEILKANIDNLTPSQVSVAKKLSELDDRVGFLTAKEIADVAGVSEATITRFSRALGFKGFPDMQAAIREHLLKKIGIGMKERFAESPRTLALDVISEVQNAEIGNIRETFQRLSPKQLQGAADRIFAARRVMVVGVRMSAALAAYLTFGLRMIRPDVYDLLRDSHDLHDQLIDIGPEDVVVGISFARYHLDTVRICRAASEKSAYLVAITDSVLSPVAQHADQAFVVDHRTSAFLPFHSAAIALLDAIIGCVALADPEKAQERFAKLDSMYKDFGFFYVPPPHIRSAASRQQIGSADRATRTNKK